MAKAADKLGRLDRDEEDAKYLKRPQRSKSISPDLRSRVASSASSSKDAGAVDEEQFRHAFRIYKDVSFATAAELDKLLAEVHAILGNSALDWEKRVDQVSH